MLQLSCASSETGRTVTTSSSFFNDVNFDVPRIDHCMELFLASGHFTVVLISSAHSKRGPFPNGRPIAEFRLHSMTIEDYPLTPMHASFARHAYTACFRALHHKEDGLIKLGDTFMAFRVAPIACSLMSQGLPVVWLFSGAKLLLCQQLSSGRESPTAGNRALTVSIPSPFVTLTVPGPQLLKIVIASSASSATMGICSVVQLLPGFGKQRVSYGRVGSIVRSPHSSPTNAWPSRAAASGDNAPSTTYLAFVLLSSLFVCVCICPTAMMTIGCSSFCGAAPMLLALRALPSALAPSLQGTVDTTGTYGSNDHPELESQQAHDAGTGLPYQSSVWSMCRNMVVEPIRCYAKTLVHLVMLFYAKGGVIRQCSMPSLLLTIGLAIVVSRAIPEGWGNKKVRKSVADPRDLGLRTVVTVERAASDVKGTAFDTSKALASVVLLLLFLLTPVSCQTAISKRNIATAVSDWVTNPGTATTTYGGITDWNTAAVTSMYRLFKDNCANVATTWTSYSAYVTFTGSLGWCRTASQNSYIACTSEALQPCGNGYFWNENTAGACEVGMCSSGARRANWELSYSVHSGYDLTCPCLVDAAGLSIPSLPP